MVDESVVKIVRKYLKTLVGLGISVRYVVVFGSQAVGRQHPLSDRELHVVSPLFDGNRKRDDLNFIWRTAARIDSRIEPIAVGQRQYEEDDSSAIIEIARREGQVISLT